MEVGQDTPHGRFVEATGGERGHDLLVGARSTELVENGQHGQAGRGHAEPDPSDHLSHLAVDLFEGM